MVSHLNIKKRKASGIMDFFKKIKCENGLRFYYAGFFEFLLFDFLIRRLKIPIIRVVIDFSSYL